jgi:hypothetical protein
MNALLPKPQQIILKNSTLKNSKSAAKPPSIEILLAFFHPSVKIRAISFEKEE